REPQHHAASALKCLTLLTRHIPPPRFHPFDYLGRMLRHRIVQVLLAADHLTYLLVDVGDLDTLALHLPGDLVRESARCLAQRQSGLDLLKAVINGVDPGLHAMPASLLVAADPRWRLGVNPSWQLTR